MENYKHKEAKFMKDQCKSLSFDEKLYVILMNF